MSSLDIAKKAVEEVPESLRCNISDGYHTFAELYEHRNALFIALCRSLKKSKAAQIWRSEIHSDGSKMHNWFILGIGKEAGAQITYHLPITKWKDTGFAATLKKAPKWDGHTSSDVIERLKRYK